MAWGGCLFQLSLEGFYLGLGFLAPASLLLALLLGFLTKLGFFLGFAGEEVAGKHSYCTSGYGEGGVTMRKTSIQRQSAPPCLMLASGAGIVK